jgi:hypothetical protein
MFRSRGTAARMTQGNDSTLHAKFACPIVRSFMQNRYAAGSGRDDRQQYLLSLRLAKTQRGRAIDGGQFAGSSCRNGPTPVGTLGASPDRAIPARSELGTSIFVPHSKIGTTGGLGGRRQIPISLRWPFRAFSGEILPLFQRGLRYGFGGSGARPGPCGARRWSGEVQGAMQPMR